MLISCVKLKIGFFGTTHQPVVSVFVDMGMRLNFLHIAPLMHHESTFSPHSHDYTSHTHYIFNSYLKFSVVTGNTWRAGAIKQTKRM